MNSRIPATAFAEYVALGPNRSYQAIADRYGVSKRAVAKHAVKERWQRRVADAESKAHQATEKKLLETMAAVNERHLKALKVIQGKALEALRALPLDTAMNAVRALDIAIKQERLIRGEPSDRQAVTIEDAIKREYNRWLAPADDGDNHGDDDAATAQ